MYSQPISKKYKMYSQPISKKWSINGSESGPYMGQKTAKTVGNEAKGTRCRDTVVPVWRVTRTRTTVAPHYPHVYRYPITPGTPPTGPRVPGVVMAECMISEALAVVVRLLWTIVSTLLSPRVRILGILRVLLLIYA